MSEVIERLKGKFVSEAATSLGRIAEWIAELHRGGSRHELVSRIREEAHGLKGAAAVLGFEEFRDRAAELEQTAAELTDLGDWPINAAVNLDSVFQRTRAARPRD